MSNSDTGMLDIHFSDKIPCVYYNGRNGTSYLKGFSLDRRRSFVEFRPINSKGNISRAAYFEIPYEAVPKICKTLMKWYNDQRRRKTA